MQAVEVWTGGVWCSLAFHFVLHLDRQVGVASLHVSVGFRHTSALPETPLEF